MSTTSEQQGKKEEDTKKPSGTYEAGCHCGYIKFSATLSPPLPEYEVLNCNCSSCTHLGYLLVYPKVKDIVWHNNGRERCASYRFNTKKMDQMFCPKCGASLGIDFEGFFKDQEPMYGISVRTFYDIDLDSLKYKKCDGKNGIPPNKNLAGHIWDEERSELK
ncbi:Mss4-like protein [Annulohypoxylon bovei var. microspora]|nr:Mss4-like protein [Annulohypoxylon bovei var. microspora]